MQVEGINPGNGHAYGLGKLGHAGQEVNETEQESGSNSKVGEVSQTLAEPTGEESENEEKAEGVIGLLQEGHFKGVADVRLRINFNEELAVLEAAQLKAVAEEKIDGVLEAVGVSSAGISALSAAGEDEGDEVSELQEAFVQAVNEAKEEFLAGEKPSVDDLVGDIYSAFAVFLEGLQNLLTPAIETGEEGDAGVEGSEEGAEEDIGGGVGSKEINATGAVVEESGDSPEPASIMAPATGLEPDLQSYIEELESAFEAAMEELIGGLWEVQILPELSEPSGNGVAYEKFLAIYNELRGIETAGEGPDEGVALELLA
jgi:hypothetical protein